MALTPEQRRRARNRRYRLLLNAESGIGASDPYWDEVVLALDFEDDFNDISSFNQTLGTQTANITQSPDQVKEGAYAARCSTESLTEVAEWVDSTDFDMGTGDFTIEGWFRTDDITGTHILAGQWNGAHSTRAWCIYLTNATLQFIYSTGGTSPITTITTGWTANTYHHIAISREGTAIRMYLNGDYQTVKNTADTINTTGNTAGFTLFNDDSGGSTYSSPGYCDMFRWTVGTARYTGTTGSGDFVPPTDFG